MIVSVIYCRGEAVAEWFDNFEARKIQLFSVFEVSLIDLMIVFLVLLYGDSLAVAPSDVSEYAFLYVYASGASAGGRSLQNSDREPALYAA